MPIHMAIKTDITIPRLIVVFALSIGPRQNARIP
jgi:hypothetical protein